MAKQKKTNQAEDVSARYHHIDGTIATHGTVDHDQFMDQLIEWVESKGWYMVSHSCEVNEAGQPITDEKTSLPSAVRQADSQ